MAARSFDTLSRVELMQRRLALALFAAIALHLPLTPLGRFVGLGRMFLDAHRESDYQNEQAAIPVELFEPPKEQEAKLDPKATEASIQAPPPPEAKPAVPPTPTESLKPAAEFERTRAAEAKKAAEEAARLPPKETPKKPLERAGLAGLGDDKGPKPNVSLALWLRPVREPHRSAFGAMLNCSAEVQGVRESGIEVMRDLDGFVIVTNQLHQMDRATVAVQHQLTPVLLHGALEELVARSGKGGRWLDKDTARIVVEGQTKLAFAGPGKDDKGVLFFAPEDSREKLRKMKGPAAIPEADGRILSVTLQKPAVVSRKVGLTLPTRLKELVLDLFGNEDGSLDARLDFEDDTEAHAREDARIVAGRLSGVIEDMTVVASALGAALEPGTSGSKVPIPPFTLTASEKRFTGMLHLPPEHTRALVALAVKLACPKKK